MSTSSSSHPLLPPCIAPSTFFIHAPAEAPVYHPKPSLTIAATATLQSGAVGLLVSTVQNALQKHDKGAMGVFTRTGGTILFFSAMGFSYSFTRAATANVRESDDALNGAMGGCAAGFLAGVRNGSLPMAVGACAFLGTVIGTFEAAGNSFQGTHEKALPRSEREARRMEFFKKVENGEAKLV